MVRMFFVTVIKHSFVERFIGWIRGAKIPRETVIENDPPKTLSNVMKEINEEVSKAYGGIPDVLNQENDMLKVDPLFDPDRTHFTITIRLRIRSL